MYEHIKDSHSHHDAQTLDVATADQQQPIPDNEGESDLEGDDMQMKEVKEDMVNIHLYTIVYNVHV